MKYKKKLILKFLKENGRSSTSRIASSISSDKWMAQKYLEELKEEGKIIMEKETRATYWRLAE